MPTIFVYWIVSALVLVIFAISVGNVAGKGWLGILVDGRGRMSLSQFQLVLWSIAILSLLAGVFIARLLAGVPSPQNIVLPNELLAVMGISTGSAVSAVAIKSSKDLRAKITPDKVNILTAQKTQAKGPSFWQLFLTEEGTTETIDFTRFQNFWLTLIVFVSYLATTVAYFTGVSVAGGGGAAVLPTFDSSQVSLLAISNGGYLAGKLPDRQ